MFRFRARAVKAFSSVVGTLVALSFAPASHAGYISLSPSEMIQVSLDGDRNTVGTVDTGGLAGSMVARERRVASQTDRRVATFLRFDVSALTPGDIVAATFDTEFLSRLNDRTQNVLNILVGVVLPDDTWSTTTAGTFPLFGWGSVSDSQQTLLADVSTAAPNSLQSVDLLATVEGWADGSIVNNGLVVFGDQLEFQGAGFDLPLLRINKIPEPATVALLGLGVAGFGFQRRKRTTA